MARLALVSGGGLLPFATYPRVARIRYLWTGLQSSTYLVDAVGDGLRESRLG